MKKFKSHFVFSRSEQNGIFLLVLIIVALQLIYYFVDFNKEDQISAEGQEEMVEFQKKIDSIKTLRIVKDTLKIFPFNPNFITDYKGYSLGMSVEEIDELHAFRAKEQWINSAEDFQKITGVHDSLLKKIAPYFKFPDWVGQPKTSRSTFSEKEKIASSEMKKDLNAATAEELMAINGIGEILAGRIVKYRNKIGGFIADIQLKDVYGLNFQTREVLLEKYTVKDPALVSKLNINTASVLELAEIPYFNYELAREIVDYRSLHEKISTFEELAKIKDFPSEKIERIALYLTIE